MHFVCLCERNESLFMALFNSKSSVQMMESVMKSLRSSSPEVPSLYWTEEPLHAHLHNCHRQNHCLGLRYHFQWGYLLYCCQIEKKISHTILNIGLQYVFVQTERTIKLCRNIPHEHTPISLIGFYRFCAGNTFRTTEKQRAELNRLKLL